MNQLIPLENQKCNTTNCLFCSSILKTSSCILWVLLLLSTLGFNNQAKAQGAWKPILTQAPHFNAGVMLLLSDGSVIAVGASYGYSGNNWDRLTPDSLGSYVNGTWSNITPMNDTRLYFSSEVLMDGRVYVAGGEYGT